MTDTLFIRLGDDQISWLLLDSLADVKYSGSGDWSSFTEFQDLQFDGRVVAVVPGETVLMTNANVPSKQYRQILQAVPFVVEEQLATDIEDCFFALGQRDSSGCVEVSVLDRVRIEKWLTQLGEMGLQPGWMISETSLVPSGNGVSVVVDGERVHIRWGVGKGITTGKSDLSLALSLVEEAATGVEVHIPEGEEDSISIQLNELTAAGGETPVVHEFEASPFVFMCQRFDGTQINLLQGEFKVEESRSTFESIWRSIAILAGCAILLHLMTLVGQGIYLNQEADKYQIETMDLYKRTFPADRNVRDVRRRWNAHLGKSESSDNVFISLLAQSSRGLSDAGLTLNNVNFNESRGDLILQVTGDRSEALVQYTQSLGQVGLEAEIGTISQEGDAVRGSIKVRSDGGAS